MIEIYTDGACNPNPGKGAWAWALDEKTYDVGVEEITTNNRMEMMAIIQAIEFVKREGFDDEVTIYSDSQYCVNGFNSWMYNWQRKGWKKRGGLKNSDLWQLMWVNKRGIKLSWVRGHSGNKMNEFADQLCSQQIGGNPIFN